MAGLPASIQSDATFEGWSIKDRLVKRLALSYFYQRSGFDVPLVGIDAAVRVHPDTPMGKMVADGLIKEGLHPAISEGVGHSIFYLSPAPGDDAITLISQLADDDPRFLFLSSPDEKSSYNLRR